MDSYIKIINVRKVDLTLNFLLLLVGLYTIGFVIGIVTALIEKVVL
jgi:hypothetical protein